MEWKLDYKGLPDQRSSLAATGTRFQLSRTPARTERGGPTLGQHIHEVLSNILGYDDDRIANIVAPDALE